MFGYIYKITMPNGRCYVGSKKKRFFDENYWSSSCNPEFWRDLEFYGKENCKREVLEWIENKEKIGDTLRWLRNRMGRTFSPQKIQQKII